MMKVVSVALLVLFGGVKCCGADRNIPGRPLRHEEFPGEEQLVGGTPAPAQMEASVHPDGSVEVLTVWNSGPISENSSRVDEDVREEAEEAGGAVHSPAVEEHQGSPATNTTSSVEENSPETVNNSSSESATTTPVGDNIYAEIDGQGNVWFLAGDLRLKTNNQWHFQHDGFKQGEVHQGVREGTAGVSKPLVLNYYDAVFAPYAQEDFFQKGLWLGREGNAFGALSDHAFEKLEAVTTSVTGRWLAPQGRFASITKGLKADRPGFDGYFLADVVFVAVAVGVIYMALSVQEGIAKKQEETRGKGTKIDMNTAAEGCHFDVDEAEDAELIRDRSE